MVFEQCKSAQGLEPFKFTPNEFVGPQCINVILWNKFNNPTRTILHSILTLECVQKKINTASKSNEYQILGKSPKLKKTDVCSIFDFSIVVYEITCECDIYNAI